MILAAYYAAEVAAKTIKAGNTNTQVRKLDNAVCLIIFAQSVRERACVVSWARPFVCAYFCARVCVLPHVRVFVRTRFGVCFGVCNVCEAVVFLGQMGGRISDVLPKRTRFAVLCCIVFLLLPERFAGLDSCLQKGGGGRRYLCAHYLAIFGGTPCNARVYHVCTCTCMPGFCAKQI